MGYSSARKLSNVMGRLDYISNEERQEKILDFFNTTDNKFWKALAKENQERFIATKQVGKCVEAREFIISVPNDSNISSKDVCHHFKEQYGVECACAKHEKTTPDGNHKNVHFHLIFSERRKLTAPQVVSERRAPRTYYYDAHGNKCKKADAVTVVKKGDVTQKGCTRYFTNKDKYFQTTEFALEVKEDILKFVEDRTQRFDKLRDFPTHKIGKNNPFEVEIRAYNDWNMIALRPYLRAVEADYPKFFGKKTVYNDKEYPYTPKMCFMDMYAKQFPNKDEKMTMERMNAVFNDMQHQFPLRKMQFKAVRTFADKPLPTVVVDKSKYTERSSTDLRVAINKQTAAINDYTKQMEILKASEKSLEDLYPKFEKAAEDKIRLSKKKKDNYSESVNNIYAVIRGSRWQGSKERTVSTKPKDVRSTVVDFMAWQKSEAQKLRENLIAPTSTLEALKQLSKAREEQERKEREEAERKAGEAYAKAEAERKRREEWENKCVITVKSEEIFEDGGLAAQTVRYDYPNKPNQPWQEETKDNHGNMTHLVTSDGYEEWSEFDYNGRLMSYKNTNGDYKTFKYRGNVQVLSEIYIASTTEMTITKRIDANTVVEFHGNKGYDVSARPQPEVSATDYSAMSIKDRVAAATIEASRRRALNSAQKQVNECSEDISIARTIKQEKGLNGTVTVKHYNESDDYDVRVVKLDAYNRVVAGYPKYFANGAQMFDCHAVRQPNGRINLVANEEISRGYSR